MKNKETMNCGVADIEEKNLEVDYLIEHIKKSSNKFRDDSYLTAGPFSTLGFKIENYKLDISYEIVGKFSCWKKGLKENIFKLHNIDSDKQYELTKEDFLKIYDVIRNIDTYNSKLFTDRVKNSKTNII